MLQKAKNFSREHIILTSFQHFAAGFGLAILIQIYDNGAAFAPAVLGWGLVLFSGAIHAYGLFGPDVAPRRGN